MDALFIRLKIVIPSPITDADRNRVSRGLAVIRVNTSPTNVVRVEVPARIASMPVVATTSVVQIPPFPKV